MKSLLEKKVLVPLNIPIITNNSKNFLPNPEYLYLKKEYTDFISKVPNENSKEEEFIGGMPVQLEKNCVKQLIKQKSYAMTLKVDGERFLMFLSSRGILYFIDRSVNFYYFMNDSFTDRLMPLNVKPFLFDGELVTHKNYYEYLIFDCLFYDNKSFIDKPYTTRYDVCKYAQVNVFNGYFKTATEQIVSSVKTWYPVDVIMSVNDIYKFIIQETNKKRTDKLKADGIILQPFDTPYVPYGPWNKYNNIQFKWKPSDQLTIDFKIKEMGPNEWHLLTKTDQPYNINQIDGDPIPATCKPTDVQKLKYHENDVVEFKFKETGNPNGNLFVPMRLRNEKEANGLATIMSTMCVIHNPFTLDILKPALKYLEKHEESKLKGYLNIFSESDLILCSVSNFFTKYEQKQIEKVYNRFITDSEIGPIEMEFRIFKVGKKGKNMDKFTFYYLQDYLIKHFKYSIIDTVDVTENNSTKLNKLRSTYKNIQDAINGNSITNEFKNKIINYTLEPKHKEKKLFNNLTFKLEIANEIPSNKVIRLRSQFAGKMVNNLIRVKNRYTFEINNLWKIDLTKVTSAYTLETLQDKNETFECECEYIGYNIGGNIPFEVFIKSMSDLYKLILSNSNYCDTCV
jgi:hypothetical protein